MNDDFQLVRQYVAERSEPAFDALVSRHIDLVYSAAWRQVGNVQLAEEITQGVFILLARKAGTFTERTIVPGWLYRATIFVSAAAVKREARRLRREQEAHMQSILESSNDPMWEQLTPVLDEAMAQLRDKDRDVIVLRYFQNKTLQQVANALGIEERAAQKRVARSVEKLRGFFARRGIAIGANGVAVALSSHAVATAPALLAKSISAIAIGKGAASGASMTALTKGALKLMAWAKAKTTVIAFGSAVLLAGTTAIVVKAHSGSAMNSRSLEGSWEGTMLLDDAGVGAGEAARTRIVLKFTKTNNTYAVMCDWIDLGRKDVVMGKVVYKFPALHIERNIRETWDFKLNADASQMLLDHAIHFTQPAPVLFLRTATPDSVPEPLAEKDFAPRADSVLQGYWKGEIGTGEDLTRLNVRVAERPDGIIRMEGDIPVQGLYGEPATAEFKSPIVKVMVATGGGAFQGRINSAKSEISGEWTQGGNSLPAVFKRADYAAELEAQNNGKDYTFTSPTELQGHWKGTWIAVFGKKTVPILLALDIAKLPDGAFSANLTSLDQLPNDGPVPASEFHYSSPDLLAKWSASGSFQGKLENGKLVGTWSQSGGGFALTFERNK
jgi:RNA polymerase sigma factor (sigma-70 family)